MSKSKSVIMTLVVAVMLALILGGAYKFVRVAFFAILAALAFYGYLRGAGDLCRWMEAQPKPAKTVEAEPVTVDDPFANDDEMDGSALFSFGWLRFHDGEYRDSE